MMQRRLKFLASQRKYENSETFKNSIENWTLISLGQLLPVSCSQSVVAGFCIPNCIGQECLFTKGNLSDFQR